MNEPLISDFKLKSMWKRAISNSLYPDNEYPAYKIYYFMLKKEIIENYSRLHNIKLNDNDENGQTNLHNSEEGSYTHSSMGME